MIATDLLNDDRRAEETKRFVDRTITISVEAYCPSEGRMRTCSFTSTVPTLAERRQMTRLMAALTDGIKVDTLSEEDRSYYTMLATVTVQCRDVPKWFMEAMQDSVGYLFQVYQTCAEHSARYLRGESRSSDSQEAGPVFRLSSTLPDAAETQQG